MLGKVVSSHPLENGLKINIIDASKKIAGDRYRVTLILRLELPLDPYLQNAEIFKGVDIPSLKDALGDRVVFEKKAERNFIDAKEKDAVFESLKNSFFETTAKYCGHPDFPAKFILKKYRKQQNIAKA